MEVKCWDELTETLDRLSAEGADYSSVNATLLRLAMDSLAGMKCPGCCRLRINAVREVLDLIEADLGEEHKH
jgi:hypothetical protein